MGKKQVSTFKNSPICGEILNLLKEYKPDVDKQKSFNLFGYSKYEVMFELLSKDIQDKLKNLDAEYLKLFNFNIKK